MHMNSDLTLKTPILFKRRTGTSAVSGFIDCRGYDKCLLMFRRGSGTGGNVKFFANQTTTSAMTFASGTAFSAAIATSANALTSGTQMAFNINIAYPFMRVKQSQMTSGTCGVDAILSRGSSFPATTGAIVVDTNTNGFTSVTHIPAAP